MARERSGSEERRYPGRLAGKRAQGIGPGPQKDPTKGTQNPFTENLKPGKPANRKK